MSTKAHCETHEQFDVCCEDCETARWNAFSDAKKLQEIREMKCGRGTYACVGDDRCINPEDLDRAMEWLIGKVECLQDGCGLLEECYMRGLPTVLDLNVLHFLQEHYYTKEP